MKVLLATPAYGGQVTTDYVLSLLDTIPQGFAAGYQLGVYLLKNESLIPRGRNRCAATALDQGWDKLFFIDADISWTWEQAHMLLRSNQALVAGTYPAKTYPLSLNLNPPHEDAHFFPSAGRSPTELSTWAAAKADPKTGEVPCRHVPTGFMLIDCSLLRKLTEYVPAYDYPCLASGVTERHHDFFSIGVNDKGDYSSEDWSFCELAAKCGVTPYLNTHVILPHTGAHTFTTGVIT